MNKGSTGFSPITETMNGCCVDKKYGTPNACTEDTCMTLPAGKTCGDCRHARRCDLIFGGNQANTDCQFFPRRFSAVKALL